MRLESLGLIGNCQFSALIANSGAVVWCCLPRFDSEPIFGTLLDEGDGGDFVVGPVDGSVGVQSYLGNTNVLETTFQTAEGSFRILDFAPRFQLYDRYFRPTKLFRIIEPISGMPHIRVRCAPRIGWSKEVPVEIRGSHHIRYQGFPEQLRLTTDLPLSYLDGRPTALTERCHLVLSYGEPVEEPLAALCDRFLGETVRYWERWVKHCAIPPHFQQEVIRSALALKLHCFEDTGAIIAATTTSIPESTGSGRTWDYRYCWLRDAYYAISAFRLLGHFEEREQFIRFLLNIASSAPDLNLAPLYRIDGGTDLREYTLPHWAGYESEGPVRVGNAAAKHLQHDVFGEMVLALAPVFLDKRYIEKRSATTLDLLIRLARKAVAVVGTPDAGIWEFRTEWKPQTFSSLMCWAAADRMTLVAEQHCSHLVAEFADAAAVMRKQILDRAWDPQLGSLVSTYDGGDVDASLLQAITLRLLPPSDPRLQGTVDAIRQHLNVEGWLRRYRADDGFGKPSAAFLICTFWLVEALAVCGRMDEARNLFAKARKALSPLDLISEDVDPPTGRLWGNFPQAYSHVGLIHAAFAASPPWREIL